MLFSHPRELKSLFSRSFTEIHRDFLHRPSSGYLPEEIWRKAGKSIWTVYCLLSPTSTWAHRHLHTGLQGLAAVLMQGQERERPLNAVIVKSSPSVTTMKDNVS